jgi:hypothetical protein
MAQRSGSHRPTQYKNTFIFIIIFICVKGLSVLIALSDLRFGVQTARPSYVGSGIGSEKRSAFFFLFSSLCCCCCPTNHIVIHIMSKPLNYSLFRKQTDTVATAVELSKG